MKRPRTQTCGAGPDVVLLHGWGFPGIVLAPLAKALTRSRRVTLVDLPGYGGTPWQREAEELRLLAASIAEVVPDGAAVFGWSLGGLVALELAASREIESLVLIGSTPRFTVADDWPCAVAGQDLARLRQSLAASPARCIAEFAVLSTRGDRHAALVLRTLLGVSPLPHAQALRAGLDMLAAADLRAALRQIEVPTLIIAGDKDRLVPPAAARFLADNLPRGVLHLLPGAAHAPFIGREVSLARSIEAFLATHERVRA